MEEKKEKIASAIVGTLIASSVAFAETDISEQTHSCVDNIEAVYTHVASSPEKSNTVIPLTQKPTGTLYAKVHIADETYEMLVDSGASYMLLPKSEFDKFGIDENDVTKRLGASMADGREEKGIPVYTLPKVRIGETCELFNIEVAVMETSNPNFRSLLGINVLDAAGEEFVISRKKKTLMLGENCRVPENQADETKTAEFVVPEV